MNPRTASSGRALVTVIGLCMAFSDFALSADSGNESVIKEGAEVVLSGKLKDGMAGIGGEHTGWVLEYQTKAGPRQIEVDRSGLEAGKVPEGNVLVTGRIIKKNFIERGPALILKATKIEADRAVLKSKSLPTSLL